MSIVFETHHLENIIDIIYFQICNETLMTARLHFPFHICYVYIPFLIQQLNPLLSPCFPEY